MISVTENDMENAQYKRGNIVDSYYLIQVFNTENY